MAKQPPIISAKPPEDSDSRSRPNAEEMSPMECPACKDIDLEFKYYYWDNEGKECEQWVCASCGLECNF